MTLLQKWLMALVGLGAGYMVLASPNAFYKATTGVRNLTAGSVVDITTGGKGGKQYS
jgi:hypothetical protein